MTSQDKALVRAPNKKRSWRAFTRNHPLWESILEMRRMCASWAKIRTYAAQRGHRLTTDQIEYGFRMAGVDYPRRVTQWVNEALEEWQDKTLPAVEDMMAALTKMAREIQTIDDFRQELITAHNVATEPAAREVQLQAIMLMTKDIFHLVSTYFHNLVDFRNAVGDAFPDDVARKVLSEGVTTIGMTTTKAMAITDSRVIYREMKRLHFIMRQQMELMVEAAKRGENIPEFAPLGPGEDNAAMDGDAAWSLEEDEGQGDDDGG